MEVLAVITKVRETTPSGFDEELLVWDLKMMNV